MQTTTILRTFFINLTGYFIYKKADLPVGIDFKEDLTNKFNINPTCIFDVGANYGQTAIYYHQLFPQAKILSFEPVKESYNRLVENTKKIKNISCFNIALGDEEKVLAISLFEENKSQLNSLKQINSNIADTHIKETVEITTLNNFVTKENIKHINLLKIDTEGFELEVLNGAENFLKDKKIQAILCEVSLSKRNNRNTQLDDVIHLLDKYDYFFVGLYETNVNYYKEGLAYSNALFIKK